MKNVFIKYISVLLLTFYVINIGYYELESVFHRVSHIISEVISLNDHHNHYKHDVHHHTHGHNHHHHHNNHDHLTQTHQHLFIDFLSDVFKQNQTNSNPENSHAPANTLKLNVDKHFFDMALFDFSNKSALLSLFPGYNTGLRKQIYPDIPTPPPNTL